MKGASLTPAGGLAAFWPSLVICPTELVKCRLQAAREAAMMEGRPQPNLGPLGLTRQLLNTEGVPGLYRGLTATFVREIPGYFFFFLAYEGVRELLKPEGGSRADVGALGTVGAGAVAGVVSLQLVDAMTMIMMTTMITMMMTTKMMMAMNRCRALEHNLPG